MNKLSNYFVRGLITLVPIVITYFVIATVFRMIEGAVDQYIPVTFPGMGVVILVTLILIVGWISETCTWGTQIFLNTLDRLVDKIPIVKFIYSSVKRVSTMLFESKTMFTQVVLLPYPHPGVKSIGFLMTKPSKAIKEALGDKEEYESVFLPWSLNMSSGFNVFVPKKDLIYLDISVEDAFQYILTAGGVMPGTEISKEMEKNMPTGLNSVKVVERIEEASDLALAEKLEQEREILFRESEKKKTVKKNKKSKKRGKRK